MPSLSSLSSICSDKKLIEKLWKSFCIFDIDGEGKIDTSNIKNIYAYYGMSKSLFIAIFSLRIKVNIFLLLFIFFRHEIGRK